MLRPRNLLVLALALLAAGGVTYAWLLSRDLAELRAQLAASRHGAEELQKKLFEAEKRPARMAPPVETAAAAPATTEDGPPGPPPGDAPGRNRGPNRNANFQAEILGDPKIGPLLMEQRKRALDQRYAALFRKLNLPADQLEKLKSLLAEKELSRTEAAALARGQGLGRDDVRAMTQQADAESDAQIKSLIGDTNYAQLTQYDQTTSQRTAVGQFAERLSYGSTPLTAQQNDQLVQILAANPLPAINGRNNVPEFATLAGGGFGGRGDMGGMMAMAIGRGASDEDIAKYSTAKAERDALVLQQAATVLAPAQLQALQQQQQEENNQIQLLQLLRARAQQEFGNQGRGNRRNGGGGG